MDYRQAAQNAILEDCIAASGNWIHAGKVVDRVALLVEAAVAEERERCQALFKAGMAQERMRVVKLLDAAVNGMCITPEFAITFVKELNKYSIKIETIAENVVQGAESRPSL